MTNKTNKAKNQEKRIIGLAKNMRTQNKILHKLIEELNLRNKFKSKKNKNTSKKSI